MDSNSGNVKDVGQELRDSILKLNDSMDSAWNDTTAKALKYQAEALLALAETYDILEGVCCCDYEDEDDESWKAYQWDRPETPVWTDAYGWSGGLYARL